MIIPSVRDGIVLLCYFSVACDSRYPPVGIRARNLAPSYSYLAGANEHTLVRQAMTTCALAAIGRLFVCCGQLQDIEMSRQANSNCACKHTRP